MNNELRHIWGLDHKCRTCGEALADHSARTYECPALTEDATPDTGRRYNPKGPKVPLLFRRYLQDFENAALALRAAQLAESTQDLEHMATFVRAKDEYKHARFVLNAYIQDIAEGGNGEDDGSE
jgi:hypothetical protein